MTRARWHSWPGSAGLALVLGLSLSCGGDGGNGPGDGGGGDPTNEFAAALSQTLDNYFTGNAAAVLSLKNFGPFIQESLLRLGSAPAGGPSVILGRQLGCIDAAILGKTYEYDFGLNAYVAGAMTGAPPTGVRFLLYQGQEPRGHVDIGCPGDPPLISVTLSLNWDGVTVLDLAGTGVINPHLTWQFITTSAALRDPDTGVLLEFSTGGTGSGTQVVSSRLGFELTSAGLTFTFGRNDFGGVEVNGQASKIDGWNLTLAVTGDVAEELAGNVVLSTVITEPEVVARLAGGYTTLQVNEATSDCAGEFPIAAGVTDEQRQLIESGYNALRAMLDAMQEIIRSGVEIAL